MKSASILIVEDEPFDAENLKLHLLQAGHRVVDVVSTGEEAIARVEQADIDLMMVDIVLSGEMDGIDAVLQIHKKHDTPVIFLTANISDELLLRAEQASPFAYLLKPFRQGELEFMIKMSLARAQVTREMAAQKLAAEAELHQAHAIIQRTNEGIMLTDKDKNIISVNPAFTRITGYQAFEAIGQKITFLSSDKHEASYNSDMWSLLQQFGCWQGDIWSRRKNGEVYPERLTINAIYAPDGSLSHYVGIFSDISLSKQAEIEKERLQRELSQNHKMEALGQLTGGIAHDFNNILGIIMGYIDISLNHYGDEIPPKMRGYLAIVQEAAERARALVAQMLTFSRNENWSEQPLHFLPLVEDNVKMLQAILPSSIKIELNCEENLPTIMMDPAKLQQLLMNLCINAKDAMEGTGTLSINLGWRCGIDRECSCCNKKIEGDWIELSVTDTGSGMTVETLERLFEPFYTTKDVGKGTGMGMSVLYGIVSTHGAHVLVDTELGYGTTIRLLFQPSVDQEPQQSEIEPSSKQLPDGAGQHILILDDEPMIAEYISDLLELSGYQTTIKTDSLEALSLLQQDSDRFSLLITDQTMSGLTGIELIKQLRETRPELPVILCTGYSEVINADDAEKMGICYLNKPIDSERLVQSIGNLLRLSYSN